MPTRKSTLTALASTGTEASTRTTSTRPTRSRQTSSSSRQRRATALARILAPPRVAARVAACREQPCSRKPSVPRVTARECNAHIRRLPAILDTGA
eukprot:6197025-Pleurochrysis_carterae.AAC.1